MEDILKKLIEHQTISESSNINLMSYIDNYLKKFDIKGKLIQENLLYRLYSMSFLALLILI